MKGLFWLTVSEASVYHGRKDVVDQSSSFHAGQEGERKRERERETAQAGSLPFPLLFYPGPQPVKLVSPTFRVGTPRGFFTDLVIQPS
jgi:hypothetical protein